MRTPIEIFKSLPKLEDFLKCYETFHKQKYTFTRHDKMVIPKGVTAGEKLGAKDAYEVLKQLLEKNEDNN